MYESKVKTYEKKGITVLEEFPEIDYALILRNSEYEPFVAAWAFNAQTASWGQGHYFSSLSDAMEYINEKINENKEPEETYLYKLLKEHSGHEIEITEYGNGINYSLEDMDTDEVIFDTDLYDLVGIA